jgi:XTP/dITP diphosphohydrolase
MILPMKRLAFEDAIAAKMVIASNNDGKLREFAALLAPYHIETIAQRDLNVTEADEPHDTFIENALAKARHASWTTGLPALSDDSGLCVNALNGAPGVISARFAGEPRSDARNNARLIECMADVTDRRAFYYCVLVLVKHASDPHPLIADAEWHGEIIDTPRGDGGFGYDPHFFLPGLNLTAAELSPETKNRLSHRGRAIANLTAKLEHFLVPGLVP